mmetsp:Transcript_36157/g.108233  ORF Transcript_36157/g.108233 Transcript_36157/m.108233 type:complete len:85 (+) Transcript_36157:445-699(+)
MLCTVLEREMNWGLTLPSHFFIPVKTRISLPPLKTNPYAETSTSIGVGSMLTAAAAAALLLSARGEVCDDDDDDDDLARSTTGF